MGALRTVVWAMLLVVADFRVNDLDVIPDPIGWAVVTVALFSLAKFHGGFSVAGVAAVVCGLASLPDMFDPADGLIGLASVVSQTVLVFATCTAIMAVLPARAHTANLIRWWDLGLSALTGVMTLALHGTYTSLGDAGAAVLVIPVVIVALGIFIWFLVLLWRSGGDELPAQPAVASAWGSEAGDRRRSHSPHPVITTTARSTPARMSTT